MASNSHLSLARSFARLTCLVAMALLTGPALAAAPDPPDRISYQGVLLDDLGQAQLGPVDLELRIWDAAIGGVLVYVQTYSTISLTDGVFNVELGPTGATTGAPLTQILADAVAADLVGATSDRFLEVTVGTESPLARTQILTVPYALRAESAAVADDAGGVAGIDASFISQIFAHTNLDGTGPDNDDPEEGLGDTDFDGIANFVDPDNDNDGLDDGIEISQGSDINLITPIVSSLDPASASVFATTTVTVNGANFQAGQSVDFGAQNPAPIGLTSTSFDVDIGPQPPGFADVSVTLANGEIDTIANAFEFLAGTYTLETAAATQLSFGAIGTGQTVVGGRGEYLADTNLDSVPDSLFSLATDGENAGGTPGQLAVSVSPAGAVVGLRCRDISPSQCDVEYLVDSDADFDLEDETAVVVETFATGALLRLLSPSIAFDPSGRPAAGYVSRGAANESAVVIHDRSGDGDFDDANERVEIESLTTTISNAGEVAVDSSGRVAFVYFDSPNLRIRAAHDRSGDGDFDDASELLTVGTTSSGLTCIGAGFAPDGDLAVVFAESGQAPRFFRDLNGDGDFLDASEEQTLGAGTAAACDLEGGTSLAVAHNQGGAVTLLIDRNDDGDFDDTDENLILDPGPNSDTHFELGFGGGGRALLASESEVIVDPTP